MGSSQGDFGWTLAGEEARGDGETGEPFSPLLFMILGRNCRRELYLEHISGGKFGFRQQEAKVSVIAVLCMCRIELFVFVGFSLVNVRRPELRPFWMLP
jgi:hypothetical protein